VARSWRFDAIPLSRARLFAYKRFLAGDLGRRFRNCRLMDGDSRHRPSEWDIAGHNRLPADSVLERRVGHFRCSKTAPDGKLELKTG